MVSRKALKCSVALLLGLLLLSLYYNPFHNKNVISEEKVSLLAENFIGNYLLGPTSYTVNIDSVEDKGYVYKVDMHIDGKPVEAYLSKDGELFFPQGINIEVAKQAAEFSKVVDIEVEDDEPLLGNPNAPVTIVEFSDYECSFCGQFALNTFNQIKENYIDTGKVKFVHKNYPLERIHEYSFKAAEAAECAQAQGKFWEYHHKLFTNMHELEVEDLKKYAKDLGLDMNKFNSCLDSGSMEEEVRQDLADGNAAGVSATPAFFINGRFIEGAQSYEVFAQIIEEELSKATF